MQVCAVLMWKGYRLYNTNYEGKAQAAIEALKTDDFVYLHVEASDEAGHEGDVPLKLKTIEDLTAVLSVRLWSGKQWDEPVAIWYCLTILLLLWVENAYQWTDSFLIYYPGIEPDAMQTRMKSVARKEDIGLMEKDEFMNLFMNIQ